MVHEQSSAALFLHFFFMDYPEYELSQELAHAGDHVPAYMDAIFGDVGSDASLAGLQHRLYRDTDAGISISFKLDDGTYIWSGDTRADNASLVPRVAKIGFSSIVEGSESVVPLQWLDLLDEELDTAEKAVTEFNRLAQETNDYACQLWHEEHDSDDFTPTSSF